MLIALASWSEQDEKVNLDMDGKQSGFKSNRLFSPKVDTLQAYQEFNLKEPITVPKNMGLFLLLEKK